MIARDRQKVFQMQVKQLMSGLTVVERRGKVQLKLRGKDQPTQTILLPFDWDIKSFDDAYTRIRNIFKFITEGHNLKAAAELAQGKAPKKGKDWAHILVSFKEQKINFGTGINIDFALELPKKVILEGFFKEQCEAGHAYVDISAKNRRLIEKAMLEVLIETQGLSEKIQYMTKAKGITEYVIEQYESSSSVEKGFVYLIRNDDIYKIGITDNLLRRFNQLKPDEVLNVVRCSNYESLEKELHKKFKKNRIPQSEYFRLSKNQIEQVNIEITIKRNPK